MHGDGKRARSIAHSSTMRCFDAPSDDTLQMLIRCETIEAVPMARRARLRLIMSAPSVWMSLADACESISAMKRSLDRHHHSPR